MEQFKTIYISEAFVPDKFGFTEEIIGEDATGPIKALILEGEFQRAEAPNRNKRVYSESLLSRETNKLQQFIKERNGLLMGMDHPLPGDNEQAMTLIQRMGMSESCGLCKHLEMANKVVYGKAQILEGDHGHGDKLAAMIRAKFKPGVSSRGIGGKASYHTSEGYVYVPEDYNMITYDFVSQPSTYNAILSQRFNEELQYFENSLKQYTRTMWSVLTDIKSKY
jgi:hypothetical protein